MVVFNFKSERAWVTREVVGLGLSKNFEKYKCKLVSQLPECVVRIKQGKVYWSCQ